MPGYSPVGSRDGPASGSPFADCVGDVQMLQEVWTELEGLFTVKTKDGKRNPSAEALMAILPNQKVLTMCYDGESARVANSVLRAKGVHSESILGGYAALANVCMPCTRAPDLPSTAVPVNV